MDVNAKPEPPHFGQGGPRWLGMLALSASILCICATLYFGRELFIPIALAVLLWFLINAVANRLAGPSSARLMPKGVAIVVAAILFGALIVGVGRIVASNASELGRQIYLENGAVIEWLRGLYADLGLPAVINIEELSARLPLGEYMAMVVGYLQGLVSDVSLVLLYVLFLLLDQRFFDVKLRALISDDERRAKLAQTFDVIAHDARTYLWLMFLISLGVGLATFGFCHLFGVKGAAFWGFVAFILNFIPTLGSIAAVLIPCAYALLTLDDPIMLGGLIASLAATQFIAGEIVLPRLMGDQLNLSSFVILFALMLWGMLWGPVGMFLAIPITVIFMSVCARFPAGRPIAVLLSKDGALPST